MSDKTREYVTSGVVWFVFIYGAMILISNYLPYAMGVLSLLGVWMTSFWLIPFGLAGYALAMILPIGLLVLVMYGVAELVYWLLGRIGR